MSSTNGLSNSGSSAKPVSSLQLDSATRDSILARNQARIMSALGIGKKDEFNTGGGLNPLKGLYSAAAASFLKNKQGQQEASGSKGSGSYERAADIMKKLGSSASSGSGGGATTQASHVSGPASGGNYKKYAWHGSGVTGSENTVEPAPVEAPQTPQPVESADMQPVIDALQKVIEEGGGGLKDYGDGTYVFNVMDIDGKISRDADRLSGVVESEAGTFTFEVRSDGAVVIDASKGNTASAEFDQLKHMLGGSMKGAREKAAAPVPETKPEAEVATPANAVAAEPAATSGETSSGSTSASTPTETKDTSLLGVLTTSTASLLSVLGSGDANDLGRYNAKLLVSDIQAAGGKVAAQDSSTLLISLGGSTGSMTLKDDRILGVLGTGKGEVKFEIRANGEVKIEGDDNSAAAKATSNALRAAIGASTGSKVDFDARIVKYNRYGTGLGLNLLG